MVRRAVKSRAKTQVAVGWRVTGVAEREAKEILRALAKMDPYTERRSWCFFCGESVRDPHARGCIWHRVQRLVGD